MSQVTEDARRTITIAAANLGKSMTTLEVFSRTIAQAALPHQPADPLRWNTKYRDRTHKDRNRVAMQKASRKANRKHRKGK